MNHLNRSIIVSVYVLVLAMTQGQSLFAQNEPDSKGPEQRFSITYGISSLRHQDMVYTPIVHGNSSLHSYRMKYERHARTRFFVELSFTANASLPWGEGMIEMDDHHHGAFPHEFLNLTLTGGHAYPLPSLSGSQFVSYLGWAVQFDVQANYYQFILSEMFGYYINNSMNIWYEFERNWTNGHQAQIKATIPVLSWMSRPPYLAEDDTFLKNISSHRPSAIVLSFINDGRLVTLDSLQKLTLEFNYRYKVTPQLAIGALYQGDIVHTNLPKPYLSVRNQLNATILVNF